MLEGSAMSLCYMMRKQVCSLCVCQHAGCVSCLSIECFVNMTIILYGVWVNSSNILEVGERKRKEMKER